MNIKNTFRREYNKSVGWVDYEVIHCDGWVIEQAEQMEEMIEGKEIELKNLILRTLKKTGCKMSTTMVGVYVEYLKKYEDDLGILTDCLEYIKKESVFFKKSYKDSFYLNNLLEELIKRLEESEDKELLKKEIELNKYQGRTSNFLFRIKSYTDSYYDITPSEKSKGGIYGGMKSSLEMQIKVYFNFLSEDNRKRLLNNILDECVTKLKANIKRKDIDYKEDEFLFQLEKTCWNSVEKKVKEFEIKY